MSLTPIPRTYRPRPLHPSPVPHAHLVTALALRPEVTEIELDALGCYPELLP
jgi:hypothetical protein